MPLDAYIVDCVRTATGKNRGALSKWHPADLGAVVCDELIRRTGIDPAGIDDVIIGCVGQYGAQAGNIGRNVVLSSDLIPEEVPGVSVNRQCGSSQQAIHFAAQAVMSGTQDMVIAGGVEIMSLIPIGSQVMDGMAKKRGLPQGPKIMKKYKTMFSQFKGAELTAKHFGITREEMDQSAYRSHMNAIRATKEGRFKNEIVPVKGINKKTGDEITHDKDEGIRYNSNIAAIQKMRALSPKGMITAATSSQISDGAAAILICNERAIKKYGLIARARIVGLGLAGSDPIMMLAGPIPATRNAFERSGLTMDDMDVYEVNEAFAPVPLAWAKELGADLSKLNVNGGAMALGHPLGCTGCKLMTTLVNELERIKGRYAVQAICEGGGTANATIIERVDNVTARRLRKSNTLTTASREILNAKL